MLNQFIVYAGAKKQDLHNLLIYYIILQILTNNSHREKLL